MKSREAKIARFNRIYADYAHDGITPYATLSRLYEQGFTGVDIALYFQVSQATVSEWRRELMPSAIDSLS